MKIYTCKFKNVHLLPQTVTPVSIALSTPSWFKGKKMDALVPDETTESKYKKVLKFGDDEYAREYIEFKIRPFELRHDLFMGLISKLNEMTTEDKPDIALCFGKGPIKFGPLEIVAALFRRFDIQIEEFDPDDTAQYDRLTWIGNFGEDPNKSYALHHTCFDEEGQRSTTKINHF